VALHTNNNTTIKSVAPHYHACQQQDHGNYTDKKKPKKKGKEQKMKRSPMEAFPLTPRNSLIAHGERNG
jgi:hypothetical protein